jgi:glycosyltransferase involved in cell wall biosynthesis
MISVALAAYKGEKYIEQQLRSILCQLSYEDEIIVSDDKPGGLTEKIVKRIAGEDSRVIWVEGKGRGVDNLRARRLNKAISTRAVFDDVDHLDRRCLGRCDRRRRRCRRLLIAASRKAKGKTKQKKAQADQLR